MPGIIEKRLPAVMSSMMSENMKEKKIKATTKVLSEKKQAKYFAKKLKELRDKAVIEEEEKDEGNVEETDSQ